MTKYNTTTLANGLRIIHLPVQSAVVYCGIGIKAGSRHEQHGEEGVAHFCEHVSFKGTRRRSAIQILNCLESVGGDLNAFTNKEDTVFYAAVLKEHVSKAVDLLCDIVFCSTYPQQEINHETDVICDEIESYNDSPAELIYDEFENMVFKGHPLGHSILGDSQRVRSFTTENATSFTSRFYRTENSIFFVYGDVDFAKLVRELERKAVNGAAPVATSLTAIGQTQQNPAVRHHQAHVMIGCPTFCYSDPRRIPLYLLNNILGGPGLSARLSLSLRERRGLVYTVESTMASYSDAGCWMVYFGCDHHDVGQCQRLVMRELDRVMQKPLSQRQLSTAKQQLKGQIAIACDNHEQFALDICKHFLHYGHERSIEELFDSIDSITAAQLQDVAQQLFTPERLQTLML